MSVKIIIGDVRETIKGLEAESVHTVVTSPPYWGLRDYGVDGQIGLEETPEEHVEALVEIFGEVRRVLREDGTLWMNYGDSYAGTGKSGGGDHGARWEDRGPKPEGPKGGRWAPPPVGLKQKDLIGMPWRLAFALREDGWYLRSEIIWHKPNPMPEPVTDRPTKSHEHIFLLSRSPRYFFDADALREDAEFGRRKWTGDPDRQFRAGIKGETCGQTTKGGDPHAGRNSRDVWTIPTQAFPGAHFATFPEKLAEKCIKAGSPAGGMVLDPFGGAGTTGLVADKLGRNAILLELNPDYAEIASRRIKDDCPMLTEVEMKIKR